MAKAEPWEKPYYKKMCIHIMGVHNLYRKENKDLKNCINRLDRKRQKQHFKSLEDAMPKDVNVFNMCRLECQTVIEDYRPAIRAADALLAAHADADPADADDRADAHGAAPADADGRGHAHDVDPAYADNNYLFGRAVADGFVELDPAGYIRYP